MADISIERYNQWIIKSKKYINDVNSHENDMVMFFEQLDDSANEGYELLGELNCLINSLIKDSKEYGKYSEKKEELEAILLNLRNKKLSFFDKHE